MSLLSSPDNIALRKRLTIRDVANRLGVSCRALRHYEAVGLITSQRETRGARIYDFETVLELETIVRLREVDIPIAGIAEILAHRSDPEAFATAMHAALDEARDQKRRGIVRIEQLLEAMGRTPLAATPRTNDHDAPRSGRFMRSEEHVHR